MKKIRRFIFIYLFMFATVIFQIASIIKLNILDYSIEKQLALKSDVYAKNSSGADSSNTEYSDSKSSVSDNAAANQDNNGLVTDNAQGTQNNDNSYLDIAIDPNISLEEKFSNCLFVGDSRTESIEKFTDLSSYADFACLAGFTISKVDTTTFNIEGEKLTLLDIVAKNKYSKIYLCLGYNELGWQHENVFINEYTELINNIKTISPDTEIIVQSVLHISNQATVTNPQENNDRINTYNDMIKQMCSDLSVKFVDLNSYFTDETGFLRVECSDDGVHLFAEFCNQYVIDLANLS